MKDSKTQAHPDLKLTFKPITDGLGFHPFSDGLPYAPVVQKKRNPSVLSSQISLPSDPIRALDQPISRIAPPNASGEARIIFNDHLHSHFVLRRMAAYCLDLFISLSFYTGLWIGALWHQPETPSWSLNSTLFVSTILIFFVFNWISVLLQEIAFKTSIGKYVFCLVLSGTRHRILIRSFLFLFSCSFLGLGLFWSLFHSEKQCWHDLLTQTQLSARLG